MHSRIEKYLSSENNNIFVQYIFTDFEHSPQLAYSSKFPIFAYLHLTSDKAKDIFDDWFNGEESFFYSNHKLQKEDFIKLYEDWFLEKQEYIQDAIHLDFSEIICNNEAILHKKYAEIIKHQGTPTLLVNGYVLPEVYELNDLKYFYNYNV